LKCLNICLDGNCRPRKILSLETNDCLSLAISGN